MSRHAVFCGAALKSEEEAAGILIVIVIVSIVRIVIAGDLADNADSHQQDHNCGDHNADDRADHAAVCCTGAVVAHGVARCLFFRQYRKDNAQNAKDKAGTGAGGHQSKNAQDQAGNCFAVCLFLLRVLGRIVVIAVIRLLVSLLRVPLLLISLLRIRLTILVLRLSVVLLSIALLPVIILIGISLLLIAVWLSGAV